MLRSVVADPKVKVKEKQIETKGPWKLVIRPLHDGRSKDSHHYTIIQVASVAAAVTSDQL